MAMSAAALDSVFSIRWGCDRQGFYNSGDISWQVAEIPEQTKLLRKNMPFPVPHLCWKQQISISTANKLVPSVKTAGVVLHWRKKPNLCACSPPDSKSNDSNSCRINEWGDTSFLLWQKKFAQPPSPSERVVLSLPQHSRPTVRSQKKTESTAIMVELDSELWWVDLNKKIPFKQAMT